MHPRCRPTARSESCEICWIVLSPLQVRQHHRGFSLAEELKEDRTPMLDRSRQLGWAHRRCPVENGFHRSHVRGLIPLVGLERVKHDWDNESRCDGLLFNQIKEAIRIEAFHHMKCTSGKHHRGHERQCCMRQGRHYCESDLLRKFPLRHLDPGHRLPNSVSHQNSLWPPGRSSCVHDGAEVLGTHFRRDKRSRIKSVSES